jgi:hypothetical protein
MMKNYTKRAALYAKPGAAYKNLFRIPAILLVVFLLSPFMGKGQPLLVEDFDYINGTLLTANGWTAHSGAGTNAITVTNPSTIDYAGYLSSGVGGMVTMVALSGEDDNITFTAQTSGTIFFSFLVNVTSASTTGDYFFHVGATTIGTTFRGKLFAKRDASNNLAFGISQSVNSGNYSAFSYALNTTYLIVLKFEIVSGATNDVSAIYINPPLNAPIPASGWISNTDASGTDLTNLGSVALRQAGTNGPALKLDGIRISTDWEDIVGAASSPTLIVSPASLTGFSYLEGNGPSASQNYSLSGINLTGWPDNIAVMGSDNYEVSTDDVNFLASVSVPYTSATLDATPIYVRLKSGLTLGNYNNENITNSGGGASTANVICNGSVVLPEPTNHATSFLAGTPTANTIPLTWTDATGGIVPTGYLVKVSSVSYDAITPPVDLNPESDAMFVKNVAAGVGTVTFTDLQPNTTHYFKIWPYTNSGIYIDYKLDGTVPQQSATTVPLYFRSAISGNWNSPATWEISSDNSTWDPATTEIPVYQTSDVTIRNGHAVTVPLSYNLGTTKDLTVENGATLYANSTTGSCFVYVYGNILNDGIIGGAADVIGFDIEGASCDISGSGSFVVSRMAKFTTANAITDLTLNQNVTLTYFSTTSNAIYNNQSGTTMFNITLSAGKRLTVINSRVNLSGCTLTLKSDNGGTASFLINNIITGMSGTNVTVERYISGWTDAMHGWHLISSPVVDQAVAPAFTDPTPANYDFYKWDELTNLWLNEKEVANGITNFVPGTGYLVAYLSAGARQFIGTLNNADVMVSNLTISGGDNSGWNLAGNPFPCALVWNDGVNWTAPAELAGTAKIWDEGTAAYVDIAPNGIIPAMNGFMVQVISGSPASMTIPAAARTHDDTPWYKNTGASLTLIAYDQANNTAQQSIIKVNDQAGEGYDAAFDSRFLPGYAPQFYSVAGEETLSTNTLPDLENGRVIEMGFVKNTASAFSIGLQAENMIPGMLVYLTDKKTGAVTELSQGQEYTFTSSEGDASDRFKLHFGALGIEDPAYSQLFDIYASAGLIYISSQEPVKADVVVTNLLGQVVTRSHTSGRELTVIDASSLKSGIYMVSIHSASQVSNRKVYISR